MCTCWCFCDNKKNKACSKSIEILDIKTPFFRRCKKRGCGTHEPITRMDAAITKQFAESCKTLLVHASQMAHLASRIAREGAGGCVSARQTCLMTAAAMRSLMRSVLSALEIHDLSTGPLCSAAFVDVVQALKSDITVCSYTCQDLKFQVWDTAPVNRATLADIGREDALPHLLHLLERYAHMAREAYEVASDTINLVLDRVQSAVANGTTTTLPLGAPSVQSFQLRAATENHQLQPPHKVGHSNPPSVIMAPKSHRAESVALSHVSGMEHPVRKKRDVDPIDLEKSPADFITTISRAKQKDAEHDSNHGSDTSAIVKRQLRQSRHAMADELGSRCSSGHNKKHRRRHTESPIPSASSVTSDDSISLSSFSPKKRRPDRRVHSKRAGSNDSGRLRGRNKSNPATVVARHTKRITAAERRPVNSRKKAKAFYDNS